MGYSDPSGFFINRRTSDDVMLRLFSSASLLGYRKLRGGGDFLPSGSPARGGLTYVDEVIGIVLVSKGIIGVDLAGLGYVEIRGAKVRES